MKDKTADSEQIIDALAAIVGATHVSSAPADVDSYGGLQPFVVVWPGSPTEVARVLKVCSDSWVAVGTAGYGARARSHWPVSDGRLRVALDTRRMTNILSLDEVALTVQCQCGIQVHHLEEALRRQGLTIGPFPVETQISTLGGLLSAPSPTAHSPRAGWFEETCLAVSIAHPDGTLVHTRVAPRKAVGPDFSRFFIGSRGGLGVITTATLRVQRLAEAETPVAAAFSDLETAVSVARQALVQGVRPARLRVLGQGQLEEELGEGVADGAVVMAVLNGPPALLEVEQRILSKLTRSAEGEELHEAVGQRWWAQHSAWKEPLRPRVTRAGARVAHSRFAEVAYQLPVKVGREPLQVWCEEATLQGVTLWVGCKKDSQRMRVALRSLLLDAGLDPIRFDFPPLMDELRAQLDPEETMVIMEGEWSGS